MEFRRATTVLLVALFAGTNLPATADDHGRELRPASWRQDATIHDVTFVDRDHGWAVGDQGLILRTTNGGQDWIECSDAGLDFDENRSFEQKLSRMRPITQAHELYPLTCRLNCVHFVNDQVGWVAGFYHTPYFDHSKGVLLKTEDGGETWKTIKISFLPQINRIHFQHLLGGWAIGRRGNLYRTGIMTTASGGNSWSSQTVEPTRDWVDGDLVPSGFVVVNSDGQLGKVSGSQYEPAVVVGDRPGRINSVRMLSGQIGWAVGHQGTVLQTTDGGMSWQCPLDESTRRQLRSFDFYTLDFAGSQVLIAGNPGSMVLSIDAEKGESISWHKTVVHAPIRRLTFVDSQHGWAVGDNGLIMTTADGGSSWSLQRQSNDQLGVLLASESVNDLPLSFAAKLCGEEQILGGTVIAARDGRPTDIAATAMQRLGCGCFIELTSDDRIGEAPHFADGQQLKELVRTIRTTRPVALVCNVSGSTTGSNSASRFAAICRQAIELAADSSAMPDQIQHAGLSPWQVQRFLIRTAPGKGDLNLASNRYLSRAGQILEDRIAVSRGLIGQSPVCDDVESFRIESFTGSISGTGHDLFFGLDELGVSIPQRAGDQRWGNLSSITTAPLKHQQMRELLAMPTDSQSDRQSVRTSIRSFGSGLEAHELGTWLMQLSEKFIAGGDLELAAFTLEQMLNRVGEHAFTSAALIWLVQYYSSSEVEAILLAAENSMNDVAAEQSADESKNDVVSISETQAQTPENTQIIPVTVVEDGASRVVWKPVKSVGEMGEAAIESARESRTQQASRLLGRLKQRDADIAQCPQVLFMEAVLSRRIPGDASSKNLLKRLRRGNSLATDIRSAASRELRLSDSQANVAADVCFFSENRPRLDGKLDDEIWQQAITDGRALMRPMRDPATSRVSRTDVLWLAWDEQFLYIAARCNRIEGRHYRQPINSDRLRDTDLQQHERIRLQFDFDRDYQSWFQLEVDSRGQTSDQCCGSPGWNPTWYVASGLDDRAWTFECAIELSELTTRDIDPSTWIAWSAARLDESGHDLWDYDVESHDAQLDCDCGFVSGLKIEPNRFNFLHFNGPQSEAKRRSR